MFDQFNNHKITYKKKNRDDIGFDMITPKDRQNENERTSNFTFEILIDRLLWHSSFLATDRKKNAKDKI